MLDKGDKTRDTRVERLASGLRKHISGSEAAVHAMNGLFQHEKAHAVLLVDVSELKL